MRFEDRPMIRQPAGLEPGCDPEKQVQRTD
jgi:hypothetical protein